MFGLKYRDVLPTHIVDELEALVASLRTLWLREHNPDGTHRVSFEGSGSGELTREVVQHTTGALAENDIETGVIETGWHSALLLSVASNRAGYLLLYTSEHWRDSDGRAVPPTEDPEPSTGVLAEFGFPVGGAAYGVTPPVTLHNSEAPLVGTQIFYKFKSHQAGTSSTVLSFTIVGAEK